MKRMFLGLSLVCCLVLVAKAGKGTATLLVSCSPCALGTETVYFTGSGYNSNQAAQLRIHTPDGYVFVYNDDCVVASNGSISCSANPFFGQGSYLAEVWQNHLVASVPFTVE